MQKQKKNWFKLRLLEECKKLFTENSSVILRILSTSAVSSQMQGDGHLSVMTVTILFSAMNYQETPLFPVCFFLLHLQLGGYTSSNLLLHLLSFLLFYVSPISIIDFLSLLYQSSFVFRSILNFSISQLSLNLLNLLNFVLF